MLYESMALCALRFQLFIRLFRHGLGKISAMDKPIWNLRTDQIPKRIMKNHGRAWCVRIRKPEFWLSKFLSVYLDVFTNNFPGRHKCSSTPDSCSSYHGSHSEPLDRWRTHRTPSVAIEVISWCRTCLPMANELGKELARWKPPCMVHHGTVVQQLNIAPFMV